MRARIAKKVTEGLRLVVKPDGVATVVCLQRKVTARRAMRRLRGGELVLVPMSHGRVYRKTYVFQNIARSGPVRLPLR